MKRERDRLYGDVVGGDKNELKLREGSKRTQARARDDFSEAVG